jgi:hypothetical protein
MSRSGSANVLSGVALICGPRRDRPPGGIIPQSTASPPRGGQPIVIRLRPTAVDVADDQNLTMVIALAAALPATAAPAQPDRPYSCRLEAKKIDARWSPRIGHGGCLLPILMRLIRRAPWDSYSAEYSHGYDDVVGIGRDYRHRSPLSAPPLDGHSLEISAWIAPATI